ncbi:MAG: non-hydrolyzing UDP-N-acetylglucosamine 2-epimerase [Acidimicrobiales bacterium]
MSRRFLVPFGTRPEIIKLAPVVRELSAAGHDVRTVATGQHHEASMADSFFEELGLVPDEVWQLSGDAATRIGTMSSLAEKELSDSAPDLVLVLGDTNTVPTFALAARRHQVPVAHIEAGLRSFNETSVEEVNRRVAAACASLHFAPTELAAAFLRQEGIAPHRIEVVGNPVIDMLVETGVVRVPPRERDGVLVTAHRATNVDDPERLSRLVDLVVLLACELGPVRFPVHPRTRARLEAADQIERLSSGGVIVLPPVSYREMLSMLSSSKVVVTDSGGLQEEASYFRVPAVVLRSSTPRWESVELSTSALVGMDVEAALEAARRFVGSGEQERVASLPCPYGDGKTSKRVARLLGEARIWELLALREPQLSERPAALDHVLVPRRGVGSGG